MRWAHWLSLLSGRTTCPGRVRRARSASVSCPGAGTTPVRPAAPRACLPSGWRPAGPAASARFSATAVRVWRPQRRTQLCRNPHHIL